MRLPEAELALVEREKVLGYLLNRAHRYRSSKVRWCSEVEGELKAPDGRQPRVRTVWQLDHGQVAPRLITAYPLEADDD